MTDLAAANQIITAIYASVGDHLKTAREQRGITQQEVSAATGVTRSSIANLEAGRQRIPLHTFIATAQAVGIDPADVITRAVQGTDPLTPLLPPGATKHTDRLRKQLHAAQRHIEALLEALPEERA